MLVICLHISAINNTETARRNHDLCCPFPEITKLEFFVS